MGRGSGRCLRRTRQLLTKKFIYISQSKLTTQNYILTIPLEMEAVALTPNPGLTPEIPCAGSRSSSPPRKSPTQCLRCGRRRELRQRPTRRCALRLRQSPRTFHQARPQTSTALSPSVRSLSAAALLPLPAWLLPPLLQSTRVLPPPPLLRI